jgi:uncharacterized damage-inducible protein DinB
MSERAEALAKRFEQVNDELIAAVEGCSDEQWRKTCSGEQWSVAVTAHHVASSHGPIAGAVQALATGQPLPPLTSEMLDAGNAEHARQFAACTRAETVELLRSGGQVAARTVRGLSDEQLDNGAEVALMGGQRVSAAQFVEMVLIGHPTNHLESIRATV